LRKSSIFATGVLLFVHENACLVDKPREKLVIVHEMPIFVDKREENLNYAESEEQCRD
jgi:hypothetical protein